MNAIRKQFALSVFFFLCSVSLFGALGWDYDTGWQDVPGCSPPYDCGGLGGQTFTFNTNLPAAGTGEFWIETHYFGGLGCTDEIIEVKTNGAVAGQSEDPYLNPPPADCSTYDGVHDPVFHVTELTNGVYNSGSNTIRYTFLGGSIRYSRYRILYDFTNSAQCIGHNISNTMYVGQTQTVAVTMNNNGGFTWSPSQYKLKSGPATGSTWGVSELPPSTLVGPGDTEVFELDITAPTTPQNNVPSFWRMWQNGPGYFGDTCGRFVDVIGPTCALSFSPTLIGEGDSLTMTLDNTLGESVSVSCTGDLGTFTRDISDGIQYTESLVPTQDQSCTATVYMNDGLSGPSTTCAANFEVLSCDIGFSLSASGPFFDQLAIVPGDTVYRRLSNEHAESAWLVCDGEPATQLDLTPGVSIDQPLGQLTAAKDCDMWVYSQDGLVPPTPLGVCSGRVTINPVVCPDLRPPCEGPDIPADCCDVGEQCNGGVCGVVNTTCTLECNNCGGGTCDAAACFSVPQNCNYDSSVSPSCYCCPVDTIPDPTGQCGCCVDDNGDGDCDGCPAGMIPDPADPCSCCIDANGDGACDVLQCPDLRPPCGGSTIPDDCCAADEQCNNGVCELVNVTNTTCTSDCNACGGIVPCDALSCYAVPQNCLFDASASPECGCCPTGTIADPALSCCFVDTNGNGGFDDCPSGTIPDPSVACTCCPDANDDGECDDDCPCPLGQICNAGDCEPRGDLNGFIYGERPGSSGIYDPLDGAVVSLKEKATQTTIASTTTNSGGFYSFETLSQTGLYHIVAERASYNAGTEEIDLVPYPQTHDMYLDLASVCQPDCTKADNVCYQECDGQNGCNFNVLYNGSYINTADACQLKQKGWFSDLVGSNPLLEVACCEDYIRIKGDATTSLNSSSIGDVETLVRLVSLNGQLAKMYITLWE